MRAHQLVLTHVADELTAGRVRLGDRLPAERALAAELGVSRTSVREAVRVLETLGVVRTAPGSGEAAGAVIVGDVASALGLALRLHMATQALPVPDVVELRVLLESWAVQAAAERREVPAESAQALDRMDKAEDLKVFLAYDAAFHQGLIDLAGNTAVVAVMSSLRTAVADYIHQAAPAGPAWRPVAAALQRQHRRIAGFIADGQVEAAVAAVRAHIRHFHAGTTVQSEAT